MLTKLVSTTSISALWGTCDRAALMDTAAIMKPRLLLLLLGLALLGTLLLGAASVEVAEPQVAEGHEMPVRGLAVLVRLLWGIAS